MINPPVPDVESVTPFGAVIPLTVPISSVKLVTVKGCVDALVIVSAPAILAAILLITHVKSIKHQVLCLSVMILNSYFCFKTVWYFLFVLYMSSKRCSNLYNDIYFLVINLTIVLLLEPLLT